MTEAGEAVEEGTIENGIFGGIPWATTCFTTATKVEVYSGRWTSRYTLKFSHETQYFSAKVSHLHQTDHSSELSNLANHTQILPQAF